MRLQGHQIAVYPRRQVEAYNLLHPAIGVLVHNSKGEIYVHQRSPNKSMHASYYDMFVGGLVLASETVPDAARYDCICRRSRPLRMEDEQEQFIF